MFNPYEGASPYTIVAPVQADRTGESIQALMHQYNNFLTAEGVKAEEHQRTILGETRSLPGSIETAGSILGALRSNDLYGRPDNYQETIAQRTNSTTAAQMDAAVRRLLDPSKFVWVVVGDAEKVKPQLESLGIPVEVREVQ